MQLASPPKAPPVRTEQIILFRCSSQIFAISSASVQEVRSVDSLAGSPRKSTSPASRRSATCSVAASEIFML